MDQIIECVPNFSEGQNTATLDAIAKAIEAVTDVRLLHRDTGYSANRTVFTFAGSPQGVIEAAFQAIKVAAELIDMRQHKGEHPRIGATDVCPIIPVKGVSLQDCIQWSKELAARIGSELNIPVYLYEASATAPFRKNLATIRKGEYEGLEEKMKLSKWNTDYGPKDFQARHGATVIGARNFLVAYNVNLNSKDVSIANEIAYDIRELGRAIGRHEDGKMQYKPGKLKAVKAIGWYIDEFECAQVSMNLTDFSITGIHEAFEAVKERAAHYQVSVSGSELIGLIPKAALIHAGKFYAAEERSEEDLIALAVKKLGLSDLSPFISVERIIEERLSTLL